MRDLTPDEKQVLNNVTRELDPTVYLGNYLQESIVELNKSFGAVDTPVNAAAAKGTLTVSGVVVDGETVVIGVDVYEFVADAAKLVVAWHIPVDISAGATASNGTLTMPVQPVSGDTVTIGEKVYTFVPVGTDTADGEVSIGANVAAAQANLVAAINGTDGISNPHLLVKASAFAANVCTITALIGGVAGDAIATTETFTEATNVFAAETLGSGADCAAADAITALVAAITESDTQGVTAEDGDGDTIELTAALGVAGNFIGTFTTMANATFGADVTSLSGGANQTPPDGRRFMVDGTNLYIYVVDTWYKIQLTAL